ncbi:MAG: methyltransferase domain-containing protein [Stagnimonas sp.]|nr:methyltransferase domain-containing protein [Stagnimonas sp.]
MSEIELHRKLLGDAPRNAAFHAALKAVIKPGVTTVADLGAGTGFLSFLARQLGAAHCTLIEYTDTIQLATQLARANKIDGLSFIQGHSAELKKPEKVDVVVSETLGNYALEENLLETLNDARRYLKKNGVLIPCGLKQYVAPVLTPRLQDEIDIWPRIGFGINLDAARTMSLSNMYVRAVQPADVGGSEANAKCWDDLRFATDTDAAPSLRRESVHWSGKSLGAVTVHGYALWWVAELVPGVTISTSPFSVATHWEQIYLPLLSPISLAATDTLECTLTSDTRPDVGVRVAWRTRQLQGGKAVQTQDQDITKGRI